MDFAKLLANVVYVPTCLRASLVYVLTCVRAKVPKACQLFIFTCQRSYDVALFYLGLPIFLLFFLRNARENFYTMLLYKKFYILPDIVVYTYHMNMYRK